MIYPSLEVSTNFKEFFILYDAFQNVSEGITVCGEPTDTSLKFLELFDTIYTSTIEPIEREYAVLNKMTWLVGDNLHIEHPGMPHTMTIPNVTEYASVRDLVYTLLETKRRCYEQYVKELTSGCATLDKLTVKHLDYFKYVVQHVELNKEYSFVPNFVLKPETALYKHMVNEGFTPTPLGLINLNIKYLVPLIQVTGKPKQKISHIPIKNARREKP